jgi:hypothetical protein
MTTGSFALAGHERAMVGTADDDQADDAEHAD